MTGSRRKRASKSGISILGSLGVLCLRGAKLPHQLQRYRIEVDEVETVAHRHRRSTCRLGFLAPLALSVVPPKDGTPFSRSLRGGVALGGDAGGQADRGGWRVREHSALRRRRQDVASGQGRADDGDADGGCTLPTTRRGWAVGHDTLILHTTDGGETWTKQFGGGESENSLLSVYFHDANHGWAVGAFNYTAETQGRRQDVGRAQDLCRARRQGARRSRLLRRPHRRHRRSRLIRRRRAVGRSLCGGDGR